MRRCCLGGRYYVDVWACGRDEMRELGAICLIEGKPAGGFRILFIPVRKGR